MPIHRALDNNQIAFIVDEKVEMDKLTRHFVKTPPSMRTKKNVHQV